MTKPEILPWFEEQWRQFLSLQKQNRMPHAILLSSAGGLGLAQLADKLAKFLLCDSPEENGNACNHCKSCGLLAAKTHPDYHKLEVLEDKSILSVDQIRELVAQCVERPHQGGYRIAVIEPGEKINASSANALLKTLEEPGSDTLIVLLADNNLQFPATILSRCQVFTLRPPDEDTAVDWMEQQGTDSDTDTIKLALRMCNGAPLSAIEQLNKGQLNIRASFLNDLHKVAEQKIDPEKFVASIDKTLVPELLKWLYSLTLDAHKLSKQIQPSDLTNFDQLQLLQHMQKIPLERLNSWIDKIVEARRLLASTSNITPQLILEDLIFRWIAIFR